MSFDRLTNKNFLLYCAKHYTNPHCTGLDEFNEDLKRLKYIKKLLTRYEQNGELKERLVLNHLIILNNVFGPEPLVKILTLKMKGYLKFLKPFLILLSILPEKIFNVGSDDVIYTDSIPLDPKIVDTLRKL